MLALLALPVQHSGDSQLDLAYFWAAVLIALLPVGILGTIGFLVVREMHRGRAARMEPPPAERPTLGLPPDAEMERRGRSMRAIDKGTTPRC